MVAWRKRLSDVERAQLDELELSAIAEYLARRLGLMAGRQELEFVFRNGRYDRGSASGHRLGARGAPAGHPTRDPLGQ